MLSDTRVDFPEALFLDRDGTLIKWVDYLCDPDLVALTPGVGEALRAAKGEGCRIFLHTNQSGVGRGYFGLDAVEAVNRRMCALMGVDVDFFDEVCIATDAPNGLQADSYRKPSPRFLLEMVQRFGLDRARCYMVGDSLSDVVAGLNAGMRAVLVESDQAFVGELPAEVLRFRTLSDFWSSFG